MRTLRIPLDALVILIAPAGAGKSTFVREQFRATEIVSSDHCRALVSDDEADQSATGPAFEVFDAIVRGRLRMGRLTVADATNLEPLPRRRLREMARAHGRPVIAIVLNVPVALAHERNLSRERTVPSHVVDWHFELFHLAREVLPTEGYATVHEIGPGEAIRMERLAREDLSGGQPATEEEGEK